MFERILTRARNTRGTDGGFTLVELLIVIVILGVLAAIVVFSVQGMSNNSKTVGCQATKNTAQTAVEAYYAQNGNYPATLSVLVPNLLKTDPTGDQFGITYAQTGGVVSATSC